MPIEYTVIITFITVACTVIGVSIGLGNLRRNSKLDDRHENTLFTRVAVQLEHIDKNVQKIVGVIDDIKAEIQKHRDRIVVMEQEIKQTKERVNEIAGRKRGDLSG